MELTGKIALVTGAAKRIGKAIAIGLAEEGADIALHYNASEREGEEAAGQIADLGRRVELFQADLAEPEQIARLLADVGNKFGRLDVLVNNAAICERTPIKTLTAKQWDRQFAINARAAALCTEYAAPLMSSGAAVINIADVSADSPWAGYPAYCASKAALVALTKSTAKALAPEIRVNAVSPGAILWTDDMPDQQKAKVLDHIPMKRTGLPEDIAAAVVFLAQQDYITGQNLRVDGGWKMG